VSAAAVASDRELHGNEEIFPWHVAIFRKVDNVYFYACGGTLVNPKNRGYVVLTAAHCVTTSETSGEIGDLSRFKVVLGAISTNFRINLASDTQVMDVSVYWIL